MAEEKEELVVSCVYCDNFPFCAAKNAADKFADAMIRTGLFRGDNTFNTTDVYVFLATRCRKFDRIED